MDSLFEKITLYDVLGYLFPGALFEMIIILAYIVEQYGMGKMKEVSEICESAGKISGYIPVMLIISGYCLGIIISEFSVMIDSIIKDFLKTEKPEKHNCGITEETLKKALIKAKVCNEQEINEILKQQKSDLQSIYGGAMYGMIQNDENYKRIHNYGSSQLMYRNVSCTLFLGGIYMLWRIISLHLYGIEEFILGMIYLSMTVVVYNRYRKTGQRKAEYVRVWFVEKYGE